MRMRRLSAGELSWVPEEFKAQADKNLRAGKPFRRNVGLGTINQRIAGWNGTVIHWIGAIQIEGARMDDLKSVLQDYGKYAALYNPLIYECRARPIAVPTGAAYNVEFGMQNVYRVGSFFPQHYSFHVKSRSDYSEHAGQSGPVLLVRWRASEIRESESGVPGRNDFLNVQQDHGILWAFNTYWIAQQKGPNLYVEFESITLARSVQNFKCRVGVMPVPKSIVSNVMESLPAESLDLMLTATRAECRRRAGAR
ncbi:MAG TPA: hypothetical protein VMZ52_17675 [Bryobacteraceae bacterium]|nr:hypothetical protein [Bryobacteraceae bacterium]